MGRKSAPATHPASVIPLLSADAGPLVSSCAKEVDSVGRVGELILAYARRDHRTVLVSSRCSSPWHHLPPIHLDETGCAYTLLVNPSGGLVGGDHLSVRASLAANSHVLFSTPSANRVYRSASKSSTQSVVLTVGPGAILEWVPDLTIPFAGSQFKQTIDVKLGRGSTVFLWDAIASGRVVRGERWAFASLENEIRITTASGGYLLERYHLTQGHDRKEARAVAGLASTWDYVASLYLVNDEVKSEAWKELQDNLAEILEKDPTRVLGGVSEPTVPGLVVKLVARSAPDLGAHFESIWAAVRKCLWDLPLPSLRRY